VHSWDTMKQRHTGGYWVWGSGHWLLGIGIHCTWRIPRCGMGLALGSIMLRLALDLHRFVDSPFHLAFLRRNTVWSREPHHLHQPVPQWHVPSLHQLGSASASVALIWRDLGSISSKTKGNVCARFVCKFEVHSSWNFLAINKEIFLSFKKVNLPLFLTRLLLWKLKLPNLAELFD